MGWVVETSALLELEVGSDTIVAVPVKTEAGCARSIARTFEATSGPTIFSAILISCPGTK